MLEFYIHLIHRYARLLVNHTWLVLTLSFTLGVTAAVVSVVQYDLPSFSHPMEVGPL